MRVSFRRASAAALSAALLVAEPVARADEPRPVAPRAAQQETSDTATYLWANVEARKAFAGSYRRERTEGARAKLRFTGSRVVWYTRTGPGQGKARVRIDGEVVRTVNNHDDENHWRVARTFRRLGAGSHTLRIDVLGEPGAPGGGRWIAIDSFRVGDDDALTATTAATFRWARLEQPIASGDHVAGTPVEGASVTFSFEGKGVDWLTVAGPNRGTARVLLDGEDRGVVDTYAPALEARTAFSAAGLVDGPHTLTIRVLGSARDASSDTWVTVDAVAPRRPSIRVFRGLGAWVDLYDYYFPSEPLDPVASVADMAAHDVRTLYIQTARYNTERAIPSEVDAWIHAAHAAGIEVVGWYLPAYDEFLDRDVRRTVAVAEHVTDEGQRFDAVGVDIEFRGKVESTDEFNDGIRVHLRRVRARVGNRTPIAGITPAPVGMAISPSSWAGFPWGAVGRYTDVVMPMAYWSYRTDDQCNASPIYCPYGYATENIERAREKTGLPVHILGGVGDSITRGELGEFVDGVEDVGAIGGGLYDYATMDTEHPRYWEHLARFNTL